MLYRGLHFPLCFKFSATLMLFPKTLWKCVTVLAVFFFCTLNIHAFLRDEYSSMHLRCQGPSISWNTHRQQKMFPACCRLLRWYCAETMFSNSLGHKTSMQCASYSKRLSMFKDKIVVIFFSPFSIRLWLSYRVEQLNKIQLKMRYYAT